MIEADGPLLDRDRIRELFRRTAEHPRHRRRFSAARDRVGRGAWALAAELGLPRWWLNEQASAYAAPGGDPHAPLSYGHPGLRVSIASPEHLLAMKTLAARRRDTEDPAAQQRREVGPARIQTCEGRPERLVHDVQHGGLGFASEVEVGFAESVDQLGDGEGATIEEQRLDRGVQVRSCGASLIPATLSRTPRLDRRTGAGSARADLDWPSGTAMEKVFATT